MMDRPPRPSDFLRDIPMPKVAVPDPAKDFGMYRQMNVALAELHQHLENQRTNYGRVGYSSQNMMSDLSKACIEAIQCGDGEEANRLEKSMDDLNAGFAKAVADGVLPAHPNDFSRTMAQEAEEAKLFGAIWPVIIGESQEVPQLTYWKDFKGNVQALLYAFLDVVSECGKSVTDELAQPDITTGYEFRVFERFLAITPSIVLRLSQERHFPGYVISNGYGHWMAFSKRLRTAYGTIAHVRREYSLRRSIQRMVNASVRSIAV